MGGKINGKSIKVYPQTKPDAPHFDVHLSLTDYEYVALTIILDEHISHMKDTPKSNRIFWDFLKAMERVKKKLYKANPGFYERNPIQRMFDLP